MNSLLTHKLNKYLLPLIGKLNKYLINIIDEYSIINIEKLKKYNESKVYKQLSYTLNKDLTIEDIIIKAIHRGYCGFTIAKFYQNLINEIDKLISVSQILTNDKLKKYQTFNSFQYWIPTKNKDLHVLDIINMENVVFGSEESFPIEN